MKTHRHPFTVYALVTALIFGAFLLRVYRLDAVPLRGDEAFNAMHWTQTPFTASWFTLIETEPNPGSLIVYWLWSSLAGKSEFALRYLPVLANLFGGAITAALAWKLSRRSAAALSLLALWMVAPFLIWHAQDARQYALLTALTPLNVYLLLRALEHDKRAAWILYALAQTLTLTIYYVDVFWMAAHLVIVLAWRQDRLAALIRAWALIAVLIVPLLAQIYVVTFVSGYTATAQAARPLDLLTVFLPTLLFSDSRWALIPALGLTVGLLGLAWRSQARALLLAWTWIPLFALTVISLKANFFLPRYVTAVTPALLLTLALVDLRQGRRIALVAAYLVVAGVGLSHYYWNDPPKAPDWPGLMGYLAERSTSRTAIILGGADSAIEYYHRDDSTLYLLPHDWLEDDWQAVMEGWLVQHDALFVLAGANTGETSAYLEQHAQSIPGDTWPNVTQFRAWDVDPDEVQHHIQLDFGGVARLHGYRVLADSTILIYWEALSQTDAEHSFLLHLEPVDGGPIIALDHALAGALVSTRTWTPGTLYRDAVALPPVLRGDYAIIVGLYPTGAPDALLPVDGVPAIKGRARVGMLSPD